MSNLCATTCFVYMPLIFMVLLVVILNILKRLAIFDGISTLLLTLSLTLLCILLIGECMVMVYPEKFFDETVNLELQAQMYSFPSESNPCISLVIQIVAVFIIYGLMICIMLPEDCMSAIKQFLGLKSHPERFESKEKNPMKD